MDVPNPALAKQGILGRAQPVRFITLIGAASLFADMTCEGVRSITGPHLGILGASATVVGIVAGFGELTGYANRLGSGWLGDRTQRYWAITIAGYVLNPLVVALLVAARFRTTIPQSGRGPHRRALRAQTARPRSAQGCRHRARRKHVGHVNANAADVLITLLLVLRTVRHQ